MISCRADLFQKFKETAFPECIIGKKLIYFPAAFQERMGWEIFGWKDGSILRDNKNYQSTDYAAHQLGQNTTDKQIWSQPTYTQANYFGCRDGYAFFKNNHQPPDGKKVSIKDRVTDKSTPQGTIVKFENGYVITDTGAKIEPEKVVSGTAPDGTLVLRFVK